MISEMRRRCEHFARCGRTGHYWDEEEQGMVRCPCLEMEMNRERLGGLFCEDPFLETELIADLGKNLILEGTRDAVVRHVAGAVLHLDRTGRTWREVTSQRLAEIWLGKDVELATTASMGHDVDLVFLWLGWGELPNKRLPECIMELVDRRWRAKKPLWVYTNFDFNQLPVKYSDALARRFGSFERIDLDD